jgi:hypothetical protein
MVEGVPKKLKRSVVEINKAVAHSDALLQFGRTET